MDPVSAIILGGGDSRRMGGRDKALVKFRGRPLIAWVVDALSEVSDDIIVVSNQADAHAGYGARVVPDHDPPCGPLGGIAAGLASARFELGVVVACDMPFLNAGVLRLLIGRAARADAAVLRSGNDYEPLHSVYRRTCLPAVGRRIAARDFSVPSFYPDVRLEVVAESEWRALDPDGRSTLNINTPEDLERLA
ncbi:MAG: molybdenum cofactor guanylyltransferase [Candidatus Aminicenantes bacterium]|nr:molybdenum cofactor guanylyltransferase [Candidatus Aminicenantes bacterium]